MTFYDLVEASLRRFGEGPRRLLNWTFKLGLSAVLAVLILSGVGMMYSSRPQFCVMCHYMEPYYKSWQKSAHHNVSCIDCHFPPDVQSELRRKFQALVQVVKYATRQYGTRPWTQIEDASCLRQGCHETRLLQATVDFNGVKFDHLPHLTRFRRVTRLRCTSCHSQIVQGQHMTVTVGTCFLCHFKPGAGNDAPNDCRFCHKFPIKTKSGFDHGFVQARGIGCQECHAEVVHGEGEVPRDRCLLCHSEPERVGRYDDTALVHENHVTARKIECQQCHNAIQHYTPQQQDFAVAARSDLCSKCHHQEHDQAGQLYAGQGADHVPGDPAPMYTAGVTCQACHRSYEDSAGKAASHAGAGGCMMCHGEAFGQDLARWREEFGAPVRQLNAALRRARDLVAAVPGSQPNRLSAWYLANRAATNGQFVEEADGVHNPEYARRILGTSALEANRALALVGLSYRVPQAAWSAAAVSSACTNCHAQLPTQSYTVYGAAFNHGVHVSNAGVQCSYCHQGGLPEQPGHGRLALTPDNCRACHAGRISSPHPSNWRQVHGPQVATQRQSCNVCHDSNWCARCHGVTLPHPSNWPAVHGASGMQRPDVCRQCHSQALCNRCHGTPMLHPSDWTTAKHGPAYRSNQQLCWRCHQGQNCASCHDLPMPHPSNWVQAHGKQAQSLAGDCATCHRQKDCLTCHRQMPPPSHQQDWPKQHPLVGKKNSELCGLCHATTNKGDVCLTCHGLPLPHADDFATTHNKVASFDKNALCFRCHDRKKFCGQCHDNTG